MSESTTAQAYLSADFGAQGGRYDWASHEDVLSWVSKIQHDWSWIAKHRQHNPLARVWQTIADSLSSATQALQQAQTHRSQGQAQHADNQMAAAKSSLENLFRASAWLLPNSAQRLFVEELRDGGKALEAALIVASWMGQDLAGAPIRQVVNGLLQWELYERGIKDRMKTESATLKRLAGDMQTKVTEYQEAERGQTGRFDALHEAISEQSLKQQESFDKAQGGRETAWKEQLASTQAELDRLKETYDKHMALAAPVEYWESKRKRHGRWAAASFVALSGGMLSGAWFLHSELQSVAQAVTTAKAAAGNAQAQTGAASMIPSLSDPAAGWRIGSFLLLATFSFWFIRLLVRIFLSNLHLENDAAERVTMAKTYLALIRNDDLPKGDNINTVLAALFRPTGDGIVKDDGVPPSTLEWFTKLGGGRQ